MAEMADEPAVRSLAGVRTFVKSTLEEQLLTESLDALNTQIKAVQGRNLGIIEKTLVAQANSLDAIFNELVCRAALNMGEYLETVDRYMRLALKAQSQCRAMLKCLAEIKARRRWCSSSRPISPTTSKSTMSASNPYTQKNEHQQNELLTVKHSKTLDPLGASTASGNDSALEAMGAINRP
jgi:hypothetical protein